MAFIISPISEKNKRDIQRLKKVIKPGLVPVWSHSQITALSALQATFLEQYLSLTHTHSMHISGLIKKINLTLI